MRAMIVLCVKLTALTETVPRQTGQDALSSNVGFPRLALYLILQMAYRLLIVSTNSMMKHY
jgi:hypothetical protein